MNNKIEATKKDILYWMFEYIKDDDNPPYTESDVHNCDNILKKFISAVDDSFQSSDFEWVKVQVKEFVLTLNAFNEKHDYSIIETDQREGICELIDEVIKFAGHNIINEDITEEWREW